MVLTPICAHSLSFRPIVMDAQSVIEIVGVHVNEGTTLSIDGQISLALTERDCIRIQRARSDFRVVNNPVRNNWDTLAAKLRWAERPRNV
jgi:NAD+ kinase